LPISAVDTISLAFQHTKRQLAQPFRFWQWTRLAFVGLLAGEAGSGGCNLPSNFKIPQQTPGGPKHLLDSPFSSMDPALLAGSIAVLVVVALVLWIVLMYISSVMRFILFDSVLAKECHIRQGWSRRQGPGWKYFLWQLGFGLVMLMLYAVLLGIPALVALSLGWFTAPRDHIAGLVLGGFAVFLVAMALVIATLVIHVLTKDFVVPQMALEGIGAVEGWRRLWKMIQAEKGGYAAYLGLKLVLAIGAGIVIAIVSVIVALVIALPAVLLGVVAAIMGKSAGLTWDAGTITVAIVVGSVLVAILLYLVALVAVPAIVFFPAYSIYFFAGRYRALGVALSPAAVVVMPPEEPPALLPSPAL
jgi:hypothetical protein